MKLNLNNNVKFHNRYELEVIDSVTGQKKQTAIAENAVTDGIWALLSASSPGVYGQIAMGTGTGEPSGADTALFQQTFAYKGTFSMLSRVEQWPTCAYTVKVSIPATASYVGTFTEIGLLGTYTSGSYARYQLWSHAMLKDAEGNQITITKTDLDILTITATIYVTFGHTDNNFIWMQPGPQNFICNAFRTTDRVTTPFASERTLCYCTSVLIDDTTGVILQVTVAQRLGSSEQLNKDTKVFNIPSVRMGTGTGNDTFYNAILVGYNNLYFGGIVFPNPNIFPNQVIAGMNIGVGDGATKEFAIPLPHFLEDTDVVYVDGVKKTRGVDYTLDNVHESVASASDLSEFLVPIGGLELATDEIPEIPYTPSYNSEGASLNNYWANEHSTTTQPLFTRYIADSKRALLKSHIPFIYKAPPNCLCARMNNVQLQKFGVSGQGGSNAYCKYNRPLMVYEARQSPALKLAQVDVANATQPTTAELQSIVASHLADPQLYTTFSGAGTLVRCVTMQSYYRRYMKVYDDECFVCVLYKNGIDAEERPIVTYYLLVVSTTDAGTRLTGYNIRNGSFKHENVTYYYYVYGTDAVSGTIDTTLDAFLSAENAPPGWTVALGNYDTAVYGICYDGCKILISGSNDRRTWNQIHSIPIVGRMDVKQDDGYYDTVKQYDTITSQCDNTIPYTYYKVELDISEATSLALQHTPAVALATGRAVDDTVAVSVLSYIGPNLTFTEPPAEGAVIKMDATIDRPYKNSNFVIDAAMTLSFGGA